MPFGQSLAASDTKRTEYPFQCGAAFAIMSKVYLEAGDREKSASYNKRFERFALQAEADFRALGKTETEAEAYMQMHVDTLIATGEREAKHVINFSKFCDRRFPE